MPDPVLTLGATVVKTALKLWMGNVPFAADVGATATDLLGKRVTDAMDRRRLQRRFDEFGDTIAQRVIDQLGHEFAGLPGNEREAAVLAVTDAFEHAELTDGSLFDQDLDPLHLERRIRRSRPQATRDLGEAAVGVYDRLLPECCAYAIATATSLPTFHADAFTELLRRDTMILQRLDKILRQMPKHSASDGEGKEARFATAYRRKAAERWDRLELFGTTARTRAYPLSLAYLSLNVTLPNPSGDVRGRREELFAQASDRRGGGIQSAEAALAGNPRLFLRGAAGSGKTTLLHWIAVRASRCDFPAALDEWNGLVPFFLPLRRYVGERLPEPEEFIRPTGSHLQKASPEGWVHRLLDEGRALLLIDGVDELPKDEREAARRWLRELLADFPRCRYVVTSRPAAVGEDWLSHQDFTSAEVQPLRDDDIRAFIRYWHRAVRSEIREEDEEEHARLEKYEWELTAKVLGQRHLRSIATTPLLCALLCALNRDRRTALPRDRIEVYQAALAMLLTDRDDQRGIPADGPSMSLTEKTRLLQELAKWLVLNGSSDVPRAVAERRIERLLPSMHRVDGSAAEVFEHLLLRCSVLTSPAVDRVAFVHRTFEEYLAARALIDEDSLPLLVKNAHDDQWREVVVMAAGQAGQRQREELIRGLLERADGVKRHHDRLQIVALACLEASTTLSEELRADIEERVRALMPPRTKAQVGALVEAGEAALRFLDGAQASDSRKAAATIRAAAGIGGDGATEVIAAVLRGRPGAGELVADAVSYAWANSPTERFAETVFPHCPPELLRFFTTDAESLGVLARHAPHVSQLVVNGRPGDTLHPLEVFPELRGVYVNGKDRNEVWRIDTGGGFALPSSVENVNSYSETVFSDAGFLAGSGVTTLGLGRPRETGNIEALLQAEKLERLHLNGRLPDLPFEGYIPRGLRELDIRADAGIDDIGGLAGLAGTDVDQLTLSDLPALRSISGIEDLGIDLKGFAFLGLNAYQDIDLSPLTGLRSLTCVGLLFHQLLRHEHTLTRLENLDTLNVFTGDAHRRHMAFPGWLRRIPRLRRIEVVGTPVVDVTGLAGAENLTVQRPYRAPKRVIGAEMLGAGCTVFRAGRKD
ncbi:NACHT domain-containing protein [Nocardiopsis sp. RSe5-2]|uniref:NACHT domain-containing protein n=1 Tax=Nocardiopsis endophytica TaxID=3018445 RepID=A0ABT4U4L2_9ACTN|nr:NACHT domain-containing protein [Nocardiopsis endophytica]MDA2811429.1 NACHT domain-containing protein [Nocardiopsis endophytica]